MIDADLLGHKTYEPGTETFDAVVAAFGPELVASDGKIDRKVLGGKVFGKPDELKRLTDIVWPGIRALALDEIATVASRNGPKVAVLEAAVMFEAEWTDLCHVIWCTAVAPELAITRLMARQPGLDEEAAKKRLSSQMSNDERIQRADLMIWNEGGQEELVDKVEGAVRETLGDMVGVSVN